jgi:membrane dipeptidase
MLRRLFLHRLALSAAAVRAAPLHPYSPLIEPGDDTLRAHVEQRRDDLVWDAMGELRPEYEGVLIRDMLGSGMDAITITLCDPKPEGDAALALAVDSLLDYDRYRASNATFFIKATSVADVARARREKKLAVLYLFQNSVQFGDRLDRVDFFHRLGVRSCQLTYNTKNLAGVGCWESGGVTPFGRELIAHMNAQRMLIDLSHANAQTMKETVAASKMPVIISHTACMAVHENRRNTPDDVMRAVAKKGGVIGICQMRPFLTTKKRDNLSAYFDHLVHAIKVAGIEHVAIGSDRDHRVITLSPEYLAELKREEGSQVVENELPYFIDELNGPRRMEVVRNGLVKRGLSAADVDRVMGSNVQRLYHEVVG